ADRHLVAVFGEHAERGVAAGRREIFWKNPREDQPDPVRNAVALLRADRSEEKVVFVRLKEGGRISSQELVVGKRAPDRQENQEHHRDRSPPTPECLHELPKRQDHAPLVSRTASVSSTASGTKNTRSKYPSTWYSGAWKPMK